MTTPSTRRSGSQVVGQVVRRSFLTASVLLAGAALPARSQVAAPPQAVTLSGQVVDRATGQPLRGVTVEIPALHREAVTDQQGRFVLGRVRPGEHTVEAWQLGYADLAQRVQVGGEAAPLVLRLEPDPVLLEGLTVKVNLLERRRMMTAVSSRVFDRQTIASSAAPNMESFVESYASVLTVPCATGSSVLRQCVRSRGSTVPLSVYLDEMPIYTTDILAAYQPSEIARVEVYQGGRQVRLYTNWFMEELARGHRWIQPTFVGG